MNQKKKESNEEQYFLDLLEEMENDIGQEENDQMDGTGDSESKFPCDENEYPNDGEDF